jgi:hypothetical protein
VRLALMGAVVAGTGGLYAMTRAHLALDKEGSAFVKDAVIAIGARWDAAELLRRATPQFRAAIREAALRAEFVVADTKLGPLVEYRAVAGNAAFLVLPGGRPVNGDYIVRAAFTKGEAEIEIHAVRTGPTCRIDSFSFGGSPEMRILLAMLG